MYFKHTISESINKPNKELEPFILKKPKTCYEYSKRILNKRWLKGEKAILKYYEEIFPYCSDEVKYIYLYAKNILKSRWILGEDLLLKYAEKYKGQYNQSSDSIAKNIYLYSKNVIKDRWKEIEQYIIYSGQIGYYLNILKKEKDIKEFKNAIQLNALKGNQFAINFNTWNPNYKIKIKGKKSFDVMIVKNQAQTKYQYSAPILAFQLEEWLTQGGRFNSKEHCYTYFILGKRNDKKNHWESDSWVKISSIDDVVTTHNNGLKSGGIDNSWLKKGTHRKRNVDGDIIKIC